MLLIQFDTTTASTNAMANLPLILNIPEALCETNLTLYIQKQQQVIQDEID